MKYSLMSLMIGDELKIKKPSFIQVIIMRSMGYEGPDPESAEEFFSFMNSRGIPAKNGTMTFRDMVKFAKENGFDGLDCMSFHFEEDGETAKQILEEFDLPLTAVNIIAPFSGADTEEQFQGVLAGVKEVMDRAKTAGCRNILLMPTGYVPDPGHTREQTYQNLIKGLRAGVAYGLEIGLPVNTETLESVGVPFCSIGEMKRIFADVPDLKYTHDTGNPIVAMEDPIETYELFKDRLANVHFKDLEFTDEKTEMMNPTGRYFARAILGEGEIDFKKHLQLLKRDGYQGHITIEGKRPADNDLDAAIKSLAYLRGLEE